MGAYLNFAKFHNLASYKAQILGAIEGNIYRIENIVRNRSLPRMRVTVHQGHHKVEIELIDIAAVNMSEEISVNYKSLIKSEFIAHCLLQKKWGEYVDRYILLDATEPELAAKAKGVFLKRFVKYARGVSMLIPLAPAKNLEVRRRP